MAFRMDLTPPFFGLNRILNVSKKVGPNLDCSNDSNDVELVQRLFGLIVPGSGALNPLGFGVPAPTGKFDALTGFYIYHSQATIHHVKSASAEIVDGCISVAKSSSSYGPRGPWTIVILNIEAKRINAAGYELLFKTFPVPPRVGR